MTAMHWDPMQTEVRAILRARHAGKPPALPAEAAQDKPEPVRTASAVPEHLRALLPRLIALHKRRPIP